MAPYFGPEVGRKTIGERLIFWIIVPFVLNGAFFLWLLCGCLCAAKERPKSKWTPSPKVTVAEEPASDSKKNEEDQ